MCRANVRNSFLWNNPSVRKIVLYSSFQRSAFSSKLYIASKRRHCFSVLNSAFSWKYLSVHFIAEPNHGESRGCHHVQIKAFSPLILHTKKTFLISYFHLLLPFFPHQTFPVSVSHCLPFQPSLRSLMSFVPFLPLQTCFTSSKPEFYHDSPYLFFETSPVSIYCTAVKLLQSNFLTISSQPSFKSALCAWMAWTCQPHLQCHWMYSSLSGLVPLDFCYSFPSWFSSYLSVTFAGFT